MKCQSRLKGNAWGKMMRVHIWNFVVCDETNHGKCINRNQTMPRQNLGHDNNNIVINNIVVFMGDWLQKCSVVVASVMSVVYFYGLFSFAFAKGGVSQRLME